MSAAPLLLCLVQISPVPAPQVSLAPDAFFAPWTLRNATVSMQHVHRQLEQAQFGNFRLAADALAGRPADPAAYRGVHYYDSDAYKWLEAACLVLEQRKDEELATQVERFVDEIAAAQRPDGYIQTQYVVKGQEPFSNLRDDHELYCAGHLIQAAIAHERATGSRELLDVALRFAELIDRRFGPEPGACGHPEIETALVQLGRATGERRWIELAAFFVGQRGRGVLGGSEYHQDHAPVREQRAATGHAVRQLYLCSGALGVAEELQDAGLYDAQLAVWQDIATSKLYVTGGLGARADGEAFGAPYELPAERAYSETCASVAWMRWSHELLQHTGEARFADALETTLYNAFLASTGLDGESFFYVNPLASRGGHRRQPWYSCACCPPNVLRTLAGLPGWFASTSADTLWLHLYDDVTIATEHAGVRVTTDYPWDGAVSVTVESAPQGEWTLALRRPGWLGATPPVTFPAGCALEERDGYLRVSGPLRTGDVVRLELPLPVELVRAHASLVDAAGKAALRRGPVIYAFEGADPGDLQLAAGRPLRPERSAELGGCTILHATGLQLACASASLYAARAPERLSGRLVPLRAIPYHLWANGADGALAVWLPVIPAMTEIESTSFADDVDFLADALVLRAPDTGPVAVSPRLSGRVMTSAFADDEPGLGFIDRAAILAGPVERGFANYGGEDRLWLAPEGGPWALFFERGAAQTGASWSVPAAVDGGPRSVHAQTGDSVSFRDRVQLANANDHVFDLQVERSVHALSRRQVEERLGVPLDAGLRCVAFRSVNTLTQMAAEPTPPQAGLVGLWVLGQFVPGPGTTVLVPFRGEDESLKRDYFGEVPGERLVIVPGVRPDGSPGSFHVARFVADGRQRGKIGLSRAGALGWIGAFDAGRGVLTLVQHTLPEATEAVPDCDWRVPNPRAADGDVATSYNHGGEATGSFFELESLSGALPPERGASVRHEHVTIHLDGDRAALARVARTILHSEP